MSESKELDAKLEWPGPEIQISNSTWSAARASESSFKKSTALVALAALLLTTVTVLFTFTGHLTQSSPSKTAAFYSDVRSHTSLCPGSLRPGHDAFSQSGYIGLEGDNPGNEKPAFFWLFQAQRDDWENRPLILTIGGGPGASGMLYPLKGESHCVADRPGHVVANPYAWTRNYNLLALDHPVGVGYSYRDGPDINSSALAAAEAYDFLQKFFTLYPRLAENKFIISSCSYGGMFVPHIASLIHRKNRERNNPGRINIKLDSVMVCSPYTDAASHFGNLHRQRCELTRIYDGDTCDIIRAGTDQCLRLIKESYRHPHDPKRRSTAYSECDKIDDILPANGTNLDNVSQKCNKECYNYCTSPQRDCHQQTTWSQRFMESGITKALLGVGPDHSFQRTNIVMNGRFFSSGDGVQKGHMLYAPLLAANIRVLHLVGELDANCGWYGVLAFLKLIPSPRFQEQFRTAADVEWPRKNATVRAVGPGAGHLTLIKVGRAGHAPVMDRPELVQEIVEKWIERRPFF